jgi:GT2 family glycosyltransferase
MNLNLSICVVTYNCEAFIERFHREILASLRDCTDWELMYFDNSPTAETARMLQSFDGPSTRIASDRNNRGFAFASNRLIEQSRYRYILLLNPDVFGFTPRFWTDLMQRATPDSVRFIRLLNADGTPQDCVGRISSLDRAFSRHPDYAAVAEPTRVGMGIMAFMLAPRVIFDRVGMLDESYTLYGEDMDWCYRAGLQHIPLIYDPALALTHLGGASAGTRWSAKTATLRKYAAEQIFIEKHYRGWYRWSMLLLNHLKRLRAAM